MLLYLYCAYIQLNIIKLLYRYKTRLQKLFCQFNLFVMELFKEQWRQSDYIKKHEQYTKYIGQFNYIYQTQPFCNILSKLRMYYRFIMQQFIVYLRVFTLRHTSAWCTDLPQLPVGQKVFQLDYSPDMVYIVVGMETMTRVYYADNRTLKCTFTHGSLNWGTVKFLPSSNAFVLAYDNSNIKIIDANTCAQINSISTGHIKVTDVDFNYDGTKMLTCGDDDKFNVWDISLGLSSGTPPKIGGGFNTGQKLWSCKFSYDDYILVGCDNNLVRVYSPGFTSNIYSSRSNSISGKAQNVEFYYCSKDKYLMGSDNTRAYTDTSTSPFLTTSSNIRLATIDVTNSFMVFGNENFELKFVFTSNISQRQDFTLPGKILSGDFSENGQKLAVGCEDNTVIFMKRCGCASDTLAYNTIYCSSINLPSCLNTPVNTTNSTNTTNSSGHINTTNNSTDNSTMNSTVNMTNSTMNSSNNNTWNTTDNMTINSTANTSSLITNCSTALNCSNTTTIDQIPNLDNLSPQQFYNHYFQQQMIDQLPSNPQDNKFDINIFTSYGNNCNQLVTKISYQERWCQKYTEAGWDSWVRVVGSGLIYLRGHCQGDVLTVVSSVVKDIGQTNSIYVLMPIPNLAYNSAPSPATWTNIINKLSANLDSIHPLLYSAEECSQTQQIQKYLHAIYYLSCAVMLIGLFTNRIVCLECLGVLQLAYFNLANHSVLNLNLFPLTKFNIFNGVNIRLIFELNKNLPSGVQILGLSSSFLNNFNIMGGASIALIILFAIIRFVPPFSSFQLVKKYCKTLLKQAAVTFTMFNIYNVSYCAGIYLQYSFFKFGTHKDWFFYLNLVCIALFLVLPVIVMIILQTDPTKFGQFKDKFKKSPVTSSYITLSILLRLSIGLYISTKNQYWQTTLFCIAIYILWLFYFFTNLPFKSCLQNYRAAMIHLSSLIILLVSNYYGSMKINTDGPIRGRLHNAAIIQLCVIGIVVLGSLCVLIWEVWLILRRAYRRCVRNRRFRKIKQVQNVSTRTNTMENMQNY